LVEPTGMNRSMDQDPTLPDTAMLRHVHTRIRSVLRGPVQDPTTDGFGYGPECSSSHPH
jgi:hypothetical protein